MTTYFVKTQTSVNSSNLLHTFVPGKGCQLAEFKTTDLVEAQAVFAKEVESLAREYTHQGDLGYEPTDHEQSHALFCEITAVATGDDGEIEDVETVELSDSYYAK